MEVIILQEIMFLLIHKLHIQPKCKMDIHNSHTGLMWIVKCTICIISKCKLIMDIITSNLSRNIINNHIISKCKLIMDIITSNLSHNITSNHIISNSNLICNIIIDLRGLYIMVMVNYIVI